MLTPQGQSLKSLSAVTFFNYAARGFIFPFISLYLLSVGFTGTQIGLVLSASAAFRLIVPPVLNAFADRTGRHRQLFYGLVMGNALATLGLVILTFSYWILGAMVVVRDSLDMPSASLLSQLTITRLQQQGRDIYGRIRAWGSFGWAVTTMISGSILAMGGYFLLFVMAAVMNMVSLLFARSLPKSTTDDSNSKTKIGDHRSLQRPIGFHILMVSWFLFFIGMSSIGGFMYPFFQQELGASNTMIGILASVGALAEIPSMIFIDRMMKRVNIRTTLIIGMLGMASLWTAFTFLQSAILLIPLMIVRGTFYTFQNIANTLIVSRISHPRNAATNQAISQVTVPALAQLISAPIAGYIFDVYGPRVLLRLVSVIAIFAVIMLISFRRTMAATPTDGETAI
ncbi:MAG: MFS transporter [Anaerolineae bacterium]